MRAEEPDARIWKGVREIEAVQGGARVQFHEGLEPRRLSANGVEVECHLYDEERRCGARRNTRRKSHRRASLERGSTGCPQTADTWVVDAAERKEILSRYMDHSRRFEAVAQRRTSSGAGEVIPFTAPLKELEQEPTAREIEVLHLISEGLVNREIGHRLFLSEETVKSHVRHLLAKLQARSRPRGRCGLQAQPDRLAGESA